MRKLLAFQALVLLPVCLWAQNPGSAAAVSSEAVTVQPKNPARLSIPTPTPSKSAPILPPSSETKIDPLLDPTRPKNCQLEISNEQTLNCANVSVVLSPGTYKQVKIVDGPQDKKAIEGTSLRPQAAGLGYIRYLSDTKLKIGETERIGGIDVGIRPQDNLPVRIWYKKMTEVDDITKAFTFIFPPLGLIAGAGAWSSGNILLPEDRILFTEARDYYLKTQNPAEPLPETAQPAIRLTPATPQSSSGLRTP
ncbi:MAG: hypothetical protein NTU87_00740 [Verrucomicrobia bacterium]|nr:hypothetical protein [Verrucomicrobiota bacterium]